MFSTCYQRRVDATLKQPCTYNTTDATGTINHISHSSLTDSVVDLDIMIVTALACDCHVDGSIAQAG
jgi:hypothetical protein